jgi:hypothetical protein
MDLPNAQQRAFEERHVRGSEDLALRAALLEDRRREVARVAGERREHAGARQRVVERAMGGFGNDVLVGSEALEGVRRRAGKQDRGELRGVEATEPARKAGALEEGRVESDVVADERGAFSQERPEGRDRGFGRGRAREVGVADPREADDDALERLTRVDVRDETLALDQRAVGGGVEPDGADLDDAVDGRVEAGGLDVDRDELLLRGFLF